MESVEVDKLISLVSGKRILIVGGTGFVGRSLLLACANYGLSCTVLSLNEVSRKDRLENVEYLSADLTVVEQLNKVLGQRQFEYVANLSGYVDHSEFFSGGREVIDVHFYGLINLLEVLDRSTIERLVYIGSSDEYGGLPAPQNEILRERPISPYSLAKVCATQLLQMLYRTENIPTVVLRLFLVYGPGQSENRFLPQIIHGCLDDSEFPVSKGEQLRDFCYIDDVVDGIMLSLIKDNVAGEVFNIASGVPVSIRSVVSDIVGIIGSGRPRYGEVPYRAGENMSLYADISYAKKMLDWSPKIDLTSGLKSTVNFYKSARELF